MSNESSALYGPKATTTIESSRIFIRQNGTYTIVGYQNYTTVKNEYALKALQFEGMGQEFNILDIAGDFEGPLYDEDGEFMNTAPTLMVRDGDGYVYYYYLADGKWDEDLGDYVPGWADGGGNPLPEEGVTYPSGTAFWILDQFADGKTMTLAGQVVTDPTSEITFGAGFTLCAAPYPKAYAFSDIDFGTIDGPYYDEDGEFMNTAVTMMVREGDGYVYYYYLADGRYDEDLGDYVPGWADGGGNPLEDYSAPVIPVGAPFWVNTQEQDSFTATFSL